MTFCAMVASATVERVGWTGLCTPWELQFQTHFVKWFGLPQHLKTYYLSLYYIIEGACSDRVIRNFIRPLFATVYKGMFILLSPRRQMSLVWPWGVTCHRYPGWHIFPVYLTPSLFTASSMFPCALHFGYQICAYFFPFIFLMMCVLKNPENGKENTRLIPEKR